MALHPLIVQAQKKLPAKTSAFEKEFVAQFFAKITGDDLGLMDAETLWRTARMHYEMMQKRTPGKAAIRVASDLLRTEPEGKSEA